MRDYIHSVAGNAILILEEVLYCKQYFISPHLLLPIRPRPPNGWEPLDDGIPSTLEEWAALIAEGRHPSQSCNNTGVNKPDLDALVNAVNELIRAEEPFSEILREFNQEFAALDRLTSEAYSSRTVWDDIRRWWRSDDEWSTMKLEEVKVYNLWKEANAPRRRNLAKTLPVSRMKKASEELDHAWEKVVCIGSGKEPVDMSWKKNV